MPVVPPPQVVAGSYFIPNQQQVRDLVTPVCGQLVSAVSIESRGVRRGGQLEANAQLVWRGNGMGWEFEQSPVPALYWAMRQSDAARRQGKPSQPDLIGLIDSDPHP